VKDLSRRKFLFAGAATAGAGLLAACGATPTPQIIEKVVEKEVTKIVEGTPIVVKETQVVQETVVVKETVVVEATAATSGPIFLVYASQYSGPPSNEADDQVIATFEAEHPEIAIKKTTWPGQDFHDKLRILATAGDLPDVWNMETKQLPDMASRGMTLDFTDLFNTESGLTKDDYWEMEWDKHFFQGKMHLLSIDTQDVIMFYNADVFDAKGIAYPPKTWDDPEWTYDNMVAIGQQIAGGEGASRIWAYDTSRWWVYALPIVWSFGGKITNDDRTESAMTMAETIAAWKYRADLINEWKITPTPAEATEGAVNQFTSGRLAMRSTWNPWMWYINTVPDLHFDIAAMPSGPAGAFTRGPQDGACIGITTKHPKESFAWAMAFAGPAGQEVFDNQLGLGTPTIKKTAELDSFIHPPVAGLEHIDQTLVLDAKRNGNFKHQDVTTKWPEMDKMISAETDSLLDGAVTAEEFCAKLDPMITELLQSIPEEQRGWVGD
jgi:multiple sugar transport system substrate-binding protein